jgi:hypothetical protein
MTDRLLPEGIHPFGAILPFVEMLFTFRTALHKERVSELWLDFCGVMTPATRTIKDGNTTLSKLEPRAFRHSWNHDRQKRANRFEAQSLESPGWSRAIAFFILKSFSGYGLKYNVSLSRYGLHVCKDS